MNWHKFWGAVLIVCGALALMAQPLLEAAKGIRTPLPWGFALCLFLAILGALVWDKKADKSWGTILKPVLLAGFGVVFVTFPIKNPLLKKARLIIIAGSIVTMGLRTRKGRS